MEIEKMRTLTTTTTTITCLLVMLAITTAAPAAIVSYDYSFEYSGGDDPSGAAPWLRATFDDGGSPGSVTLTITALTLAGIEFVNDVYFNLDPSLDPDDLQFSVASTTGSFATPSVLTGVNDFKAGGATEFDIQVDFANAPPAARFGAGESIQFNITGIPTLTANSFDTLSVPGGHGPFPTVAKIQAIGANDGSGWVTIPEPGALGLLGLASLALLRRRT